MRHRRVFTEEWRIIAVGAAFVAVAALYAVLRIVMW